MDDLKQSVQNAVYEQKDPLLIYKFESFNLFKSLINRINKDIVSFLLKSGLPSQADARKQDNSRTNNTKLEMSRPEGTALAPQNKQDTQQNPQKIQPIRAEEKINRNAPCPCGSGKKYKKCHGR